MGECDPSHQNVTKREHTLIAVHSTAALRLASRLLARPAPASSLSLLGAPAAAARRFVRPLSAPAPGGSIDPSQLTTEPNPSPAEKPSQAALKGMFGKYFTDHLLEIDWDAEVTFTHTTTMFRTSVSLATDGLRARVTRVLRLPFVIRMSRDAPASSHPAPRSLS